MDFDSAINAHVDWKMKLRGYIAKPDKSLNPDVVCKDDQCALGKWIYSEGKTHASLPEYESLRKEHARFHKTAADVIRKADAGDKAGADAAIGTGSEYATVSNLVVTLIRNLRAKVTSKAA